MQMLQNNFSIIEFFFQLRIVQRRKQTCHGAKEVVSCFQMLLKGEGVKFQNEPKPLARKELFNKKPRHQK